MSRTIYSAIVILLEKKENIIFFFYCLKAHKTSVQSGDSNIEKRERR